MFGLSSQEKKEKSISFIASLPSKDHTYLKDAYSALDAQEQLGQASSYAKAERIAVERELTARGFVHMVDF